MGDTIASGEQTQVKFVSKKSPDYRLEFVNGALSNITPRGEIVCEFHLESRDMPMEQVAILVGDGKATLSPFQESVTFTRDVKFGIMINASLAKDIVKMLNKKIEECEKVIAERAERGNGE